MSVCFAQHRPLLRRFSATTICVQGSLFVLYTAATPKTKTGFRPYHPSVFYNSCGDSSSFSFSLSVPLYRLLCFPTFLAGCSCQAWYSRVNLSKLRHTLTNLVRAGGWTGASRSGTRRSYDVNPPNSSNWAYAHSSASGTGFTYDVLALRSVPRMFADHITSPFVGLLWPVSKRG